MPVLLAGCMDRVIFTQSRVKGRQFKKKKITLSN